MIQLASIVILLLIIIISLIKQYVDSKIKTVGCLESLENMTCTHDTIKTNKIDEFCNKNYKKIWLVFIGLLFISVIYKFGELPIYIGVDEAGMAYDAQNLVEYGTDRYKNSFPLYFTNFGSGQSALCVYLVALCIKFFGINMIAYRIPTLLIYLMSVIVSYLLVSKEKDKKTALLFTFLIITSPWNIENARMALDCNLYAGLFMLDLLLLNNATKSYQYLLAGLSIGITLYTYCLSWITMPFFLLIWVIYMFYTKKMNFKQLIILGIPIVILAAPLIYFILLNYGIVNQTQLGIFTVPRLPKFGVSGINIANILKYGLSSLKTIFLSPNKTIYIIYVPLFICGYILEFKKAVKEIKNKKNGLSAIMIIAFTTLCLGLLTTNMARPNKANVLYIPILYFVTIAILFIVKNSRILSLVFIIVIIMLFTSYEYYYYTYRATIGESYYEDSGLIYITQKIEENTELKGKQKYVLSYKCSPEIYNLIGAKVSPEEYISTVQTGKYANETMRLIKRVADYNYIYTSKELNEIDLNKDNLFIISKKYENISENLQANGYKCNEYREYYILTK